MVATGHRVGQVALLPAPDRRRRWCAASPTPRCSMFPTKALAQDQLRSLRSWLVPGLRAVTYDGDTSPDDRAWARKTRERRAHEPRDAAPGHPPVPPALGDFLMRLRLVVVDELHTLRGIFGSHVAHVLRRLRRVCAHYGSSPSFCFASATIGNPAELATALCGLPVDRGRRRRRAAGRAVLRALAAAAARRAHRARARRRTWRPPSCSRASCATATRRSRSPAAGAAPSSSPRRPGAGSSRTRPTRRTASPRTGPATCPEERRELERRLGDGSAARRRGDERARARHRRRRARRGRAQRLPGHARVAVAAGRAGRPHRAARRGGARRRRRPARPVVRRAPGRALRPDGRGRGREPAEPVRARPQVACAAHELPLEPSDERWFGPGLDDAVRELVLDEQLKPRGGRMYWAGREPPAPRVGLRTGSSVEYRLVGRDDDGDDGSIGTVDDAASSTSRTRRALPAPGPAVAGRAARPRRPRGVARAGRRRRRVHPGPRGHRHRDRRRGRPVPCGAGLGAPRFRRGHEPRRRVPAQAGVDQRDDRGRPARPAAADAVDPRVLVHGPADRVLGRGRSSRTRCSARCTRPSTR